MTHNRFFRTAVLTLSILLIAGCGSEKRTGPVAVFPVTGILKHNGKPVEGADITFFNEASNTSSFGRTDAEGRFRMTTYSSNDGAIAGKNIVTIAKTVVAPPAAPVPDSSSTAYIPPGFGALAAPPAKPAVSDVPAKYGSQQSSGLIAVVQESDKNQVEFDLND